MSAHDLLRAGGWRMRTIGGEPHWEHSHLPEVYHSTDCAMEQALAWAQRDVAELRKQLAAPRMNDVIQIRELEQERDGALRKASDALSRAERLETEAGDLRARLQRADDFIAGLGLLRKAREQAVLAAMASADRWALQLHVCKDTEGTWCHAAAVAELARRDAEDDQPSTEERGAGGGKQFHPPAESTGAGGVPNPAPRSCEDEDRDLEGETLP